MPGHAHGHVISTVGGFMFSTRRETRREIVLCWWSSAVAEFLVLRASRASGPVTSPSSGACYSRVYRVREAWLTHVCVHGSKRTKKS